MVQDHSKQVNGYTAPPLPTAGLVMELLNNLELIDVREFSTKSLAGELDDFSLLADMDFQEKEMLARQMHVYRATAGADIFGEGDQGVFICFILDGKVELIKDTDDGRHKRLTLVGPGKTVGEMALIDGERRSASARCVTDANVAVLTKIGFDKLAEAHLALAFKLMWRLAKLVSQRLRQTTGMLVDHLAG
jgi:CRP-like cAMP-binding protein